MAVALNTVYEISSGEVTVSVVIGEGQIGSSLVRLGTREITIGAVTKQKIGKGTALGGKELFIKTVVTDVSDQTNRLSVRYELKGGKANKVFDLESTVAEEGDSVVFRATFKLKKA